MKLFFKNGVYASLSLSRIFNTLGASIFNIVFVVFASSMPNPKFAIAVANFIVLVPTFFTIFAGIKADKTIHKARWLIHFGYLQALLFVLVAFMTRSSSYLSKKRKMLKKFDRFNFIFIFVLLKDSKNDNFQIRSYRFCVLES